MIFHSEKFKDFTHIYKSFPVINLKSLKSDCTEKDNNNNSKKVILFIQYDEVIIVFFSKKKQISYT